MVKYCQNCGEKLDDDSVFCMSCGTQISKTESSTVNNINESLNKINNSIDKVSNDFSDSFSDLINIYKINMMDGEVVIRHSEIHQGCLYAPLLAVGISFLLMIFTFFILSPFFILALIWLIIRFISFNSTDLILTNKGCSKRPV